MTIRYARTLPPNAGVREYEATADHIRRHLSAVADPDDGDQFVAEVRITRNELDDGRVELIGELDREPDADYLRDDYDPYDGVPDELRSETDR